MPSDENSQQNDAWREKLSPQQYDILRCHGTEQAFTGEYNPFYQDGVYHCAGCGTTLFSSEHKYDSGSGWPSFYQPIAPEAVAETTDTRYGMTRTEIHCPHCQGHLGHVFPDGPQPTGLRYCMNSAALKFEAK